MVIKLKFKTKIIDKDISLRELDILSAKINSHIRELIVQHDNCFPWCKDIRFENIKQSYSWSKKVSMFALKFKRKIKCS